MHSVYRVRPAVTADIASVAALERTTENVPQWTVADYVGALVPPPGTLGTRRCFFVAETASLLAGFAVGRVTVLETDVLAELESVAVADSARRKGIGRALCGAVIGWAREHGATEVDLEVRSRSDGAIALYKSLGFAKIGLRPGYYHDPIDDAVLMRLG